MILAIDVGNTRLHTGLFLGSKLVRASSVNVSDPGWRDRVRRPLEAVVIASVNPQVTRQVIRGLKSPPPASICILGENLKVPIRNRYRTPGEVGVDRLANAVAAFERTRRACMVVDVGTAVTIDVVSARGEFLGGAIAPGPSLAAKSLNQSCSLLPEVMSAAAPRSISRSTAGNIRAGIYWSLVGLINQMAKNVQRRLRAVPVLIGTGGGIGLLKSLNMFDTIVPALTLEGVAISYYHARKLPCPFCRKRPSRR